jgi:hypothetical protein
MRNPRRNQSVRVCIVDLALFKRTCGKAAHPVFAPSLGLMIAAVLVPTCVGVKE